MNPSETATMNSEQVIQPEIYTSGPAEQVCGFLSSSTWKLSGDRSYKISVHAHMNNHWWMLSQLMPMFSRPLMDSVDGLTPVRVGYQSLICGQRIYPWLLIAKIGGTVVKCLIENWHCWIGKNETKGIEKSMLQVMVCIVIYNTAMSVDLSRPCSECRG